MERLIIKPFLSEDGKDHNHRKADYKAASFLTNFSLTLSMRAPRVGVRVRVR